MNEDNEAIRRIIQEVALKHNIALSHDDPILMVYTINHHLMQCSAGIQHETLERFHKDLETAALKWHDAMNRQTAMAVQSGLLTAKQAIAGTVRSEIEGILKQIKTETHKCHHGTNLIVLSALMTLAASATVLWMVLITQ